MNYFFPFLKTEHSVQELPNIKSRGPFLESPGNLTGPKSKIQIEI